MSDDLSEVCSGNVSVTQRSTVGGIQEWVINLSEGIWGVQSHVSRL